MTSFLLVATPGLNGIGRFGNLTYNIKSNRLLILAVKTLRKKPILVTGSHRSGTTWVGNMLAFAPKTININEPFKIKYRPGVFNKEFLYWFTYVTSDNQHEYYRYIQDMIDFRYHLREQLAVIRTFHEGQYALKSYLKFWLARFKRKVPILKDPLAIFSAEWMSTAFSMSPIVLIRHPAAFANSLMRYNHTFPFNDFLSQPLLMRDHLHPYIAEISEYADREHNILEQAALLWKCIYSVVTKYQATHPNWFFIRHEDISLDPLLYFQQLYNFCGFELTTKVEEKILEYSSSSNPVEIPINASHHFIKLNSRESLGNWRRRLSEKEIAKIRHSVEVVSHSFYSDEDW